ncbi:ion channel protein [Ceratobasidium sp. AG-Ba]|nr:ion channel protein [Ceratobasidium sp. AG-Ba]
MFDRRRRGESGDEERGQGAAAPGDRWGIVRNRVRQGTLARDDTGRKTLWRRMRDYLWGQEDEESRGEYIPNYRWTPILSGVIIPFAILLEIPGLTEHWYIRTVANKTVETQENPKILDAGLAISMASAVLANIALIFRFLERRVRLATWVAICGLVVHDIINIVAVTIFGVVHAVDDGFTYGQAFWMTICSTIASVITTVSLAWDLYRTPEFARSGSGLTRKQRSLVIIVMVLLCYIALGAMCYSFIIDLTFQNGLYFTVVSIETVGFGDIILTTTLGRVFSIFYNTFGIINLGLAVSTTRETIIESFENSYRKRRAERDRAKHARAQIRAAEQMLRRMGAPVYVPLQGHHLDSGVTLIQEKAGPLGIGIGARTLTMSSRIKTMDTTGSIPTSSASFRPGGGRRHHAIRQPREPMVLNVWALTTEQTNALFGGDAVNMPNSQTNEEGSQDEVPRVNSPDPQELCPTALIERFHEELGGPSHEDENPDYSELKTRLESEEKKEFAVKLGVAWSLFVAFWLVGAGVFVATEGWTFGVSLFFCFCTFSTVGYGDFAPKTPAGRAFFVGWALFGIAAMTILISVLTEAYSSRYQTVIHSGVLDRAVKSIRAQRRSRTRPNTQSSHSHHSPVSRQIPDPDGLAVDIVTNARAIREHMDWFVNSSGMKGAPEGVLKVLDDIAEGENMDERVKKEFMSNDEARKTVFIMSFERMLHNLACAAEEAARMPRPRRDDEDDVSSDG